MSVEVLSRSLVAVWRSLRSMRTALILLLLLGVASVFGSLVPQAPIAPQAVADLFRTRPVLAEIYRALGLFDVYGSWWFTLAYVLLLVSLVSCLLPRSRALLRARGRRAAPMRDLDGLRHFAEATVPGEPRAALDRSRSILRRRRFRVTGGDGTLAAEKGGGREAGSLVFHWAFVLLLAGIVYGKGFGFTGQATVVEGEVWTESQASYDFPPRTGRFFSPGMHRGFQVRVEEFRATFHPNGVPEDFVTRVTVLGETPRPAEIRVNHPLDVRGVKLYQLGYGWAPVVEVRDGDELLASGPVVFVTDDPADLSRPWTGVIKLPSLDPQVGIELQLLPDLRAGLVGAPMLEAEEPFLLYRAWRGDLRLTAAQSVFRLDREGLEPWESGGIPLDGEAELPGGLRIAFTDLRRYTQLHVNRDPGEWIVLAAAGLVLVGLIPALYSSRRRVWVRATREADGTRLQVGGFALQRKAAFEDEFRALVGELVR